MGHSTHQGGLRVDRKDPFSVVIFTAKAVVEQLIELFKLDEEDQLKAGIDLSYASHAGISASDHSKGEFS